MAHSDVPQERRDPIWYIEICRIKAENSVRCDRKVFHARRDYRRYTFIFIKEDDNVRYGQKRPKKDSIIGCIHPSCIKE